MFGTFRYTAQGVDTEFIGCSCDPSLGPKDSVRYVACDRCRSKKLRCSGQTGGCDRCRQCSSACVYSLDGKGRNTRRRKNPKGPNNISSISPGGETSSDAQPASNKGQDCTSKTREQDEQPASAIEQARRNGDVMQDMTDMFTAGNSPTGSFEDDFTLTEEVLNGFLPGFSGQSMYEDLDASNIPNQTKIDREGLFLDGVFSLDHIDSTNTDLAPSDTSMANAPIGPTRNAKDLEFSIPPPIQQPRQANGDPDASQAMIPLKTAHVHCRCLETVAILLEGLDGKSHAKELTTLDSALAWQKEAMGRCDSVLNCVNCVARPEYILFLELITEKLTSLFELTVSKYISEAHSSDGDGSVGSKQQHEYQTPSADIGKVFLGKYEIESPEEWSGVIRVLMGMQLRTLWTLLQQMPTVTSPGPGPRPGPESGGARRAKVQAAEERVVKLVRQLWQPRDRATILRTGRVR